ncbi:MAG: hypothetical protein MRZ92_00395 [Lactobacillus sp.]|nr:hypothetical protein [Lactobacillus sp.]
MNINYDGALNSVTGLVSFSNKVTFIAPISINFNDLDGNIYNAYGNEYPDYAASFKDVMDINYGEELGHDQIQVLVQNYLDQYIKFVWGNLDPNFQIYGYFVPSKDGSYSYKNNISSLEAADQGRDGFTFNPIIVYKVLGPVDKTETVKKRDINIHDPRNNQIRTIIQKVTFQLFRLYTI